MKYFVTLFIAVVTPLNLVPQPKPVRSRDNRFDLNELLQVEARSAADRIQAFTDGIRDQLGWVVEFPGNQARTTGAGSMGCACCSRCRRLFRSRWSTRPGLNGFSYPA